MAAEFDTVADWTADVALALGPDHRVPAGCRGSGDPTTLEWFIDALQLTSRDRMLDAGAGVGGPSAFARERVGVRPVLAEPEPGACRSAKRLFDMAVVRCDAVALPFPAGTFDVAWCLGVLCTVKDQLQLLRELSRVLVPGGRLGLLVFVADKPLPEHPQGNHFPGEDTLRDLVTASGFRIENTSVMARDAKEPAGWQARVDAVESELDRRHHDDPAWHTSQQQSGIIGRLIGDRAIRPLSWVVSRP
jgi:SAM-dependent methyltransferase